MPPHPSRRRRTLRSRLRRSPVLWWAATVALAGLSGLTVESSLARAEALSDRFGHLRVVPVVTQPVALGEEVPAVAVRFEARPATLVPRDAVARRTAGRVALVPLVAGEVVLASKLAPTGLRGAVALLPPGTRALAIPGGPAGRPPTRLGDRVDLLATFPQSDAPTVVVAEGATVVATDPDADTVTVAVHADEAPQVAYALAAGTVSLALTPP